MALTHKQQLFIAAYLGDSRGNATDAARRAGYSGTPGTLRVTGSETLANPNVAAEIAKAHAVIAQQGIASKQNRINAYEERWRKLHAIIDARAEAHAGDAPGADTGLLVRTYKQVGQGPGAQLMEEWAVDTGLTGALLSLEQQAAKEMGQWVDKGELGGPGGATLLQFTLKIDRRGDDSGS